MIFRVYRTLQILSIDIVIGAVVLLRFFCAQLDVKVGWEVHVMLGGVVWLIYTADHLRDAELSFESSRERYLFHRKYQKLLIFVAGLILCILSVLLFFIPSVIFLGGIILAAFSLVYLQMQQRLTRFLSKELYVAVVYSAGILMPPFLLSQAYRWDIFLSLVLLSLVNLCLFSWFEKEDDLEDGFHSIATKLPGKRLEKMMVLLLSGGFAIAILSLSKVSIFFLVGFILYFMMIVSPEWFRVSHRYRAIGDGVFLLPILYEWL